MQYIAQFSAHDIAQAIAQSQVETVPYQHKAARKEQHEYTVTATMGKARIVDYYIAYNEGDAVRQFKDDYAPGKGAQVSAHRTKLSRT